MLKDFCSLLLALLLFVGAAGAQAPGEPADDPLGAGHSHVEIKLGRDSLSGFRQELERGEGRARLMGLLQGLAKNPSLAQLDEFRRELQKYRAAGGDGIRPDDPSMMIQRWLDLLQPRPGQAMPPVPGALPELGLDLNRIQDQLRNLPAAEKARLQEQLEKSLEQASAPPESPLAEPQSDQPSSSVDLPDPEQWFEQWLIKQVKRIDTNSEVFHSPAVQDMFKELNRLTRTNQWDRLPRSSALSGVDKSLVEWGQRLQLEKAVSQLRLPPLQNLSVGPSESSWRLPRLRLPSWATSAPTPGGSAAPSTGAGGGAIRTLILAAALGALVWLAVVRYRRQRQKDYAARAVPTAWPVPPDTVSSREELIQAFEYLSLAQLGPEARSQHHRALAEELGGTEPPRQRAAGQLADLYEQARYAPEQDPLPADGLHAARQSLALLAGKAPV